VNRGRLQRHFAAELANLFHIAAQRHGVQAVIGRLRLALVTNMGWFTPLGSTLVGFIFLALDKIGRDLEDPFENTIYDVPLTSITRTIEVNLRQLLDETNLPQPEAAVRGVLW